MIDILIESKYCFIVAFVACFLFKDVQAYSILVSEIYLRCVDFLNETIVLELIFYDSSPNLSLTLVRSTSSPFFLIFANPFVVLIEPILQLPCV